VLDQGQQKRLRRQRALLCKSSRDVDSRKLTLTVVLDQGLAKKAQEQRALLCKPSRDVDSRKLTLAVILDQGLAKKTQGTKEKWHCYANRTDIYGNRILSCQKRIARKERKEKEKTARKWIKEIEHGHK
jgi:hypothetical protein